MTKFNKKSILATAITLSLALSGTAMATNGYFSHAYSQKDSGTAGAGVANVSDVDSLTGATNPANMVFAGDRWDLGISLFSPNRTYEVTGNPALPEGFAPIGAIPSCSAPGQDACQLPFSLGPQRIKSENQLFPIPSFGWNKMLSDRSSFGVMVYGNGGMNTEYQGGTANVFNPASGTIVTAPGTFGAGTTGIDLMQLFVAPTYSMKIGENSSIGVSAILGFQRFEATGLGNFAGVTIAPNQLSNNGYSTAFGYGLKVGFNSKISDNIRFGASYQTETNFGEFDEYRGLFAEGGNFDVPSTWTIGIAADVSEKGIFLLDIQRINYSDIKAIGNGIEPLTQGQCFDALNAALFGGSPAASGPGCGGGSNGFGFGWDDMTVVKTGYEHKYSDDLTVRVGYSKTSQPIGSDDVIFNILAPAVIETHITAGFTKQLADNSEFTVSFMYGGGTKVSGPNPFDPGQTISIEMDQYQVGFTYSRK